MHKNLPAWQFIQQALQRQVQVMLLYVLESKGSSPGRQGFMMAVDATGKMSGSFGGGIMEYKFVELAKARLLENKTTASVHQQIHDKAAAQNQSGMICSGEQTIFLYNVKPGEKSTVTYIVDSLKANKNGTLQLSPAGIQFSQDVPLHDFFLKIEVNDFLLVEKTGYKQQLFIVGGGHCSLALAQLMSHMDFYIRVYEDRNGLNTVEQNHFVHEKILLNDYADLATEIASGSNHYLVIMTFGYRTDDIAVRALLEKEVAYFGLLGSKKKVEKMMSDYQREGISAALLQRIHAPIGLPIKSQSPEEIAVSIAAEIIKVKNAKL